MKKEQLMIDNLVRLRKTRLSGDDRCENGSENVATHKS